MLDSDIGDALQYIEAPHLGFGESDFASFSVHHTHHVAPLTTATLPGAALHVIIEVQRKASVSV